MPHELTPTPELALRLQRSAERNPGAYRAQLVVLALVGDVTLTLAQVLPLALPIAIGALWLNNVLFYWLAAASIVFMIWVMRPQYRTRGRKLTRDEAPQLFDELDRLRAKLDVRGHMEVYVDERFNASAGESPGLVSLVRPRRARSRAARAHAPAA